MKKKVVPVEDPAFDWIDESQRLERMYPDMRKPIRCENGCGAVIEMADAFTSYVRKSDGENKLICQCCAADIGHVNEDEEMPDESPVCHRKPPRKSR